MYLQLRRLFIYLAIMLLTGCSDSSPWNNPYPAKDANKNILYTSFSERPKHLDPVQSYSSNEYQLHNQIYEPILQYHYLKRPYELTTLTAQNIPVPQYFNTAGQQVSEMSKDVEYSLYTIKIKPGIMYQPHPAFAKKADGTFYYHDLNDNKLENIRLLSDFKHTGTMELTANDYVYQIKRLAHPKLHSPILGLMNEYIVGLKSYSALLATEFKKQTDAESGFNYFDLSHYDLAGVKLIDRYTYQVKIRGKYPQFLYWLAMPFFSPVPRDVDYFYSQPGMKERNLTLDWYPVGTGPYMIAENNPNRQMVLVRNPAYHDEFYPDTGNEEDAANGLLKDAGKKLPFIDKVVFSLEKESIPYWNKFLQGYYDFSGIASDSFDKAVQFSGEGGAELTPELLDKGIELLTDVEASTFYIGFNMLDETVGGYKQRQRKLRQAISIAINYEEFISIFRNGRGIVAQSPIPPGIFGFSDGEQGINSYVYDWANGKAKRKSIKTAKKLLAEAGYPNGIDTKTGRPLLINFDITAGGPEDKAMFDWFRKQFAAIDLQLVFRDTDYNRFQEKMRTGKAQVYMWGWNADYPDPENFLFLLYGPNGKAKFRGENASNYNNKDFNKLFREMKSMRNSEARLQIIKKMIHIIQQDAPWIWGFHPKQYVLKHGWIHNYKSQQMLYNTMKYRRIETELRHTKRTEWNQPKIFILTVILIILAISLIPAIVSYRRKEHKAIK